MRFSEKMFGINFTIREVLVLTFDWTMRIGKSLGSSRICRNGGFVSRTNSISKPFLRFLIVLTPFFSFSVMGKLRRT